MLRFLMLAVVLGALAACGGGGSDSQGGSHAPESPSAGPSQPQMAVDHAVPVKVDARANGNINIPYASVTVCVPGSAHCSTIDRILVDTGSTGLRIVATALPPDLLPALPAGNPRLAECQRFLEGSFLWGSVRLADVHIGGEVASALPIQLIGDPAVPAISPDCSAGGYYQPKNSAQALGSNGILGIGPFILDCPNCARSAVTGSYYACADAVPCLVVQVPAGNQVQNPVAHFAVDNNGSLLRLPAAGEAGSASLSGELVFGIGTQPDNAPGSAAIYPINTSGNFTTVYQGTTLPGSFIDSGSNALFFQDGNIPRCHGVAEGFYCPSGRLALSAGNVGPSGPHRVEFSVTDAKAQIASGNFAFDNVAGQNPDGTASFDWGLPFFFGRTVYTALEGRSTPAGPGPYWAY